MNNLKAAISNLCPDGVPYRQLWEVTYWDKRFNEVENFKQPKVVKYKYFLASDLKALASDNREIKLLTTYKSDLWTKREIDSIEAEEGEIVAIPWGGNPIIQYYKGKFLTADNRIAVARDASELNMKFLYYVLSERLNEISEFYRGSGIKHPSMAKILDMRIPIPPILVQDEIVKILDTFTELESELEAERESRFLQMQHYARAMTEIFSNDQLTTMRLSEFAEIGTGSRNTQDAIEGARYPFYVRSQTPLSIDRYEFDEQAVLTAGDGVGVGKVFHFVNGKYSLHQRAYRIRPDNSIVDPKFLYYYMKNNFGFYLELTAVHASVTSLRRPMFEKFEVTFPPLESQFKIVHFLDLLEAYIGDSEGGIQKELDFRRKQYEYYRNKLLTFKELEVA